MSREKLHELDVIRSFSAIGVVFTHYMYIFLEYAIPGSGPNMLEHENGDWGGSIVGLFFVISGAALYYNHPVIKKGGLLNFYKKRWLSIFPMFYVAWAVMYYINSERAGGWYWGGPRKNFLLTFFGMDGYLMHHGRNYYCLGEWFLGAIIIFYILYPIIIWAFNRIRWISTAIVTLLFILNPLRHYLSSAPDSNIFFRFVKFYNSHIIISDNTCLWTCLMYFWLGLLFIEYRDRLIKPWTIGLSIVIVLVIALVPLGLAKIYSGIIMASALYVLLSAVTPFLLKLSPLMAVIRFISKYSYGTFLVHHVLLYAHMAHFRNTYFTQLSSTLFFIPIYAIIILNGVLLTKLVDILMYAFRTLITELKSCL